MRSRIAIVRGLRWALGLSMAIVALAGPAIAADRRDASAGVEALPWLSGLEEGHRRALADRKPVLALAGVDWCPNCRKLDHELEDPKVQAELHRWTRVYVDVDRSPADAHELNVSATPALRIRSPGGWTVAARDGYLSNEELVAWLGEHYEAALREPNAVLLESGKADAVAVVELVGQLGERSPAVREAAVRRLLPYPAVARAAVVEAFREGSPADRVGAARRVAGAGGRDRSVAAGDGYRPAVEGPGGVDRSGRRRAAVQPG